MQLQTTEHNMREEVAVLRSTLNTAKLQAAGSHASCQLSHGWLLLQRSNSKTCWPWHNMHHLLWLRDNHCLNYVG